MAWVDIFRPFLPVCLFLPPNLWNSCVCVCVSMCYWPGLKSQLTGTGSPPSQPQNVSAPHDHTRPHPPPSVSWPSCTACLSQGCTPACLRLPLHLGLSAALEEEQARIGYHYSGESSTAHPRGSRHCRNVGCTRRWHWIVVIGIDNFHWRYLEGSNHGDTLYIAAT